MAPARTHGPAGNPLKWSTVATTERRARATKHLQHNASPEHQHHDELTLASSSLWAPVPQLRRSPPSPLETDEQAQCCKCMKACKWLQTTSRSPGPQKTSIISAWFDEPQSGKERPHFEASGRGQSFFCLLHSLDSAGEAKALNLFKRAETKLGPPQPGRLAREHQPGQGGRACLKGCRHC